jgi:hypothetical protein
MDLNQIFDLKNITDSSKKLYIRNILKLNDGKEIKNLKFLNNEEAILGKLEKYKPNTRRSFIISIVSLLKCMLLSDDKKYKKMYDKYYAVLDGLNKELKTNNSKNDKEENNWLTQEEIESKVEHYKPIIAIAKRKRNLDEREFKDLLHFLVLCLYTLQAPRRNADYQNSRIVKKMDKELLTNFNVVDLENRKFHFTKYKTKGSYNIQEQDISDDLMVVLKLYVKHHPLKKEFSKNTPIAFLVDYKGNELKNNNDITRILYKIFEKKVGSSMLRKIYLTSKYGDTLEQLKEDAEDMGTSVGTIQNHYIKED